MIPCKQRAQNWDIRACNSRISTPSYFNIIKLSEDMLE